MITKDFAVTVDFEKQTTYNAIKFVQDDTLSSKIVLTLYKNKVLVDLTDVTVGITFLRPDNTRITVEADVTGTGTAEYLLASNILDVAGRVNVAVALFGTGGERLTNAVAFNFDVVADLGFDDEGIPESDQYPILTQLIADVEALETLVTDNEAAREIAEGDRVLAEDARVLAEDGRVSVEADRVIAEDARVLAEDSRVVVEAARVVAEDSRVLAEGLRADAEIDRALAEDGRVSVEADRVLAEDSRVLAEDGRVLVEADRVAAEAIRVGSEDDRVAAEIVREASEVDRDTAEGLRAAAAISQSDAEALRVIAEDSRVVVEAARVVAEDLRESDTQDRLDAMDDAVDTTQVIPKTAVADYAAILSTYSSPETGWLVQADDTKKWWRYDGSTWVNISNYSSDAIEALVAEVYTPDYTTIGPTYSNILAMADYTLIKSRILWQLKGITYTNTGLEFGLCQDTADFDAVTATLALSTTRAYGTHCVEATSTAASGDFGARAKVDKFPVDASQYYLVSAFIRLTSATNVALEVAKGSDDSQISITATSTSTTLTRVGLILQPSDITGETSIKPYVKGTAAAIGNKVAIDGVIVNKISAADYALGVSDCLTKYPFVINTQSTGEVAIEATGKNLFDKSSNIKSNSGISHVIESGRNCVRFTGSSFINDVFPLDYSFKSDTQYTIQYTAKQTNVGANQRLRFIYTDGTNTDIGSSLGTSFVPISATSASGKTIDYIRFVYTSGPTESLYIDKDTIQIEFGDTATTYEPYTITQTFTPAVGKRLPNDVGDTIEIYQLDGDSNPVAIQARKVQRVSDTASISDTDYDSIVKGTDPTNLSMEAHGLVSGDLVYNDTQGIVALATLVSADKLTHTSIAGQAATDTIKKYQKGADEASYPGTNATTIIIPNHEMTTGDFIRNVDRSAIRQVTVSDPDTLLVASVTDQAPLDIIERYYYLADDVAEVGIDYVITTAFSLMATPTTTIDGITRYYNSAGLERTEIAFASITLVASAGKYATTTDKKLYICITGGTYADIAAARTGLGTSTLDYELATYVTTELQGIADILAHPDGAVYITPGKHRRTIVYDSGLALPYELRGSSKDWLESVTLVDGETRTPIDKANITVASATSLTYASGADGEFYDVIWQSPPEDTTQCEATLIVAVNQAARTDSIEASVINTSKELSQFSDYTLAVLLYQAGQISDHEARIAVLEAV